MRDLYENRPLEWALRKTYLEYLSENNLNEIIPFGIVEKLKIFSSVGRQYELPATFTNTKKPKITTRIHQNREQIRNRISKKLKYIYINFLKSQKAF